MTPGDPDLARAFETTWPAAEYADAGAFRVGRGHGAGGRVSSARALRPDWDEADIPAVEAIHRRWRQRAMFRLPDCDDALAKALIARGYQRQNPTAIMALDCAALRDRDVPGMTAFTIWPPLAIQGDIWAAGNIGAARQAVMPRVALPRTAILGRHEDRAAGAAFVAVDGPVAMIHAIEVAPGFRRKGLAGWLIRRAATWADAQGATRLGLAVSRANTSARALYDRMGFAETGGYAYWARD
ncbi:GNAT family N-acetyltransferase [Paracoccus lutimaris]|uniref:Acetyltransferase (GNAT) family protein n=1 Tax=Paracoccus lutimaris TaxID=1490030 RepID=A0A368YV86_9RHOB|nr:GNAT family N-acetyltransferase [Paracoccus lutimaris]RCW84083.1 acetyltransferase (GNAT) family protein [Paracoccus lutimaris]